MLVFEILPAAIGIAISPLPIMIVVLLLVAGNSRSAVYYVIGWLLGIVAVGVGLVALADAAVSQKDPAQEMAIAWASILMGLIFLLMAYISYRAVKAKERAAQATAIATATANITASGAASPAENAPLVIEADESVTADAAPAKSASDQGLATANLPGWMRAIDKVTPLLAVVVALVSAFNPKNLSMILLAVADINHADVGPLRGALAYLNFAALATATVALPVLYWYFDRTGAESRLRIWQRWLAENQNVIMMWLFLVLGTLAVFKGIQRFF